MKPLIRCRRLLWCAPCLQPTQCRPSAALTSPSAFICEISLLTHYTVACVRRQVSACRKHLARWPRPRRSTSSLSKCVQGMCQLGIILPATHALQVKTVHTWILRPELTHCACCRQVRLCLIRKDFMRAQILIRKVLALFLSSCVPFRSCPGVCRLCIVRMLYVDRSH